MRSYPIDSDRVRMISTGAVKPVAKWVKLADGSRRPDPNGEQDRHEVSGALLWTVEVIIPGDDGDDRDRTAVTEIQIASNETPQGGAWGDLLVFEGLVVTPGYLNKKTNQLTQPRWSAEGIRGAGAVRGRKSDGEQAA